MYEDEDDQLLVMETDLGGRPGPPAVNDMAANAVQGLTDGGITTPSSSVFNWFRHLQLRLAVFAAVQLAVFLFGVLITYFGVAPNTDLMM
jgi:hypothetical protein